MNVKNNKGLTLISLILTVIIILIITAAMIYNTQNQLQMKSIHNLSNDIETLNAKVDEYYLKYGELPKLCDYTTKANTSADASNFHNKEDFRNSIVEKAEARNSRLNVQPNSHDSDEYIVIDLEKLDAITLTYGYDLEYRKVKREGKVFNPLNDGTEEGSKDVIEDELYVINTKTHQIYFPHGIFVDDIMYYTF